MTYVWVYDRDAYEDRWVVGVYVDPHDAIKEHDTYVAEAIARWPYYKAAEWVYVDEDWTTEWSYNATHMNLCASVTRFELT